MKKTLGITIGAILLVVLAMAGAFILKHSLHQREVLREIEESPVLSAIQSELGQDMDLRRSQKSVDGTISYYNYYLNTYEQEVLTRLESVLNHLEEPPRDKITVNVWDDMPFPSSATCAFSLANYTGDKTLTEDGKFTCLRLQCAEDVVNDDFFMNPFIYTAFTDIRHLSIANDMQMLADEAGLDWSKIWPNLEAWDVYAYRGGRVEWEDRLKSTSDETTDVVKKKPDETTDVVFLHLLAYAESDAENPSGRVTYISKNGNCFVADDIGDWEPIEQMLSYYSLNQLLEHGDLIDACDDDAFTENCRKLRELAEDGCTVARPDGLPQDRTDVEEWYGLYYDEDWNVQALLLHETHRSCELYADDARANEIYEWLRETLESASDHQPE